MRHPNRTIAGVFEPGGVRELTGAHQRVVRAVGTAATVLELGSLVVGFSGPPPVSDDDGFCLLDGEPYLAGATGPHDTNADNVNQRWLADAYRNTGEELLLSLRGEFVIIILRHDSDCLSLIRDHFGGRPLFLLQEGRRTVFASEIRDLLRMLSSTPGPNPIAVANWLETGTLPGGMTLYQGITALRPGHVSRISPSGARTRRYWSPVPNQVRRHSPDEVDARLHRAIGNAIERRLPPEGPVGVLLGGGLDASTVAALMRERYPSREIRGYSALFPHHPSVDESDLIAATTRALGMSTTQVHVGTGSLFAAAVTFQREWSVPLGPVTHGFLGPLIARSGAEGMTVLLDGEGGDELFGVSRYLLADLVRRGRLKSAWSATRRPSATGLYLNPVQMLWVLWHFGVFPSRLRRSTRQHSRFETWLLPWAGRLRDDHADEFAWTGRGGPSYWAWLSWILVESREIMGMHDFFRRQSAGHVTRRHPFLDDVDLIEAILSLPPEVAYHPELDRPALRRLTAGIVPDEIRRRREKTLWNEVLDVAVAGVDRRPLAELLLDPRSEIRHYVDTARLAAPLSGSFESPPGTISGWPQELWRLAGMELWLRSLADFSFLEDAATMVPTETPLRFFHVGR